MKVAPFGQELTVTSTCHSPSALLTAWHVVLPGICTHTPGAALPPAKSSVPLTHVCVVGQACEPHVPPVPAVGVGRGVDVGTGVRVATGVSAGAVVTTGNVAACDCVGGVVLFGGAGADVRSSVGSGVGSGVGDGDGDGVADGDSVTVGLGVAVAGSLRVSSVFAGRSAPGATHAQQAAMKKDAVPSATKRAALPTSGERSRLSTKRRSPRLS